MIPSLDRVTRRGLLRSASASMLLPFLPSLSWAVDPSAPPPVPPKRWATIIFANGVHDENWWTKGQGADMELSVSLKPLERHRGLFSSLVGLHLFEDNLLSYGPHSPFFTNFLSGARLSHQGVALATSCDQVMAKTIGKDTFLPSLHLSGEQTRYATTTQYPSVISNTMSWSSPTNAITPHVCPRDAFDDLFDTKGLEAEKSVLDGMANDLNAMRNELSPEDRRKMEEFADSVRELENRIDRASAPRVGWRPTLSEPDLLRPAQNAEQALQLPLLARHKMLMRILELAFQMDKTRIATFILESDESYISLAGAPGVTNIGLHALAHHNTDPELTRQFIATNTYHASLMASLMDKLRAIDEGGSTLLDNSMILFGSNVRDNHNGTNIPLILAGGGGGTLKPGASLLYEKMEDQRLCNLHLALMQRMGVTTNGKPIQSFANSIKPLPGI